MTTIEIKIITPSAMAALTPAETEVAGDWPIEEDTSEFKTVAVLLAEARTGRSVFGVEALVVRVERNAGAVATFGDLLVPVACEG